MSRRRGSAARGSRLAPRAAALALALGSGTAAATAEEVVVRSGEHGGFTRLALRFETAPAFDLEPIPGGYRLSVDRRASYDLSEAWRRIGRERIASLAPGPDGALDIRLACECRATAFVAGASLVVIDVAEAEAGERPPALLPPVLSGLPAPVLGSGLPLVAPAGGRPLVPVAAPRPEAEPRSEVEAEAALRPKPEAETEAAPRPEPGPEAPDLAAFGADLAARLVQGVEDGLLVPARPLPEAGDPPRPVGGQIRISTAMGREPAVAVDPEVVRAEPEGCPAPGLRALLPGGAAPEPGLDAMTPLAAVAEARAALYGEFDRLDPEAARRLIGALLAAGLGAEARAALDLAPMDAEARAGLDAVGALMDARAAPGAGAAVEGWAPCAPAAALWSVLAMEGRPLPRALDRGGVVGVVSTLPQELRAHLAPRLAGAFLDDGDAATARLVRNAATRAGGEPDRAMRLLDLRLDLAAGIEGAPDAARDLAALAAGTDDVAVEAATLLLEGAAGDPPEGALEDAALLVAERRGGAEGERLRALLADALMDAARWDEALALASDAPRGDPDAPALWEGVARRLAAEAADPTFLRLAFAEARAIEEAPVPPEAAAAIAARREALGFGAPLAPGERAVVSTPPPGRAWRPQMEPQTDPQTGPQVEPEVDPGIETAAPARLDPPLPLEAAGASGPAEILPSLTGPIASGQRSLDDSRRRRAALAERLSALGPEAGEGAMDASAQAEGEGAASTLR